MDTALPQKIPFILDRNLAKANGTENHVCTSCDKGVLGLTRCSVSVWNDVQFFFNLKWCSISSLAAPFFRIAIVSFKFK